MAVAMVPPVQCPPIQTSTKFKNPEERNYELPVDMINHPES